MPITPADDYLIHQTPYPVDRVATSDRNFYDRYFFNGYAPGGDVYFGVAMGQYPNLGVTDAAFSVAFEGRQRVVRASQRLGADRLATAVGPIRVEVVRPLRELLVRVEPNAYGIEAELRFTARAIPVEEPHFFRLAGNVPVMDYTRMTQHGTWSGWLRVDGREWRLEGAPWWGSRDHSWGIRPVGGRDPRGAPPQEPPQFFWNWAPVNFPDLCVLATVSELADGTRWHESGVILRPFPAEEAVEAEVATQLRFRSGTRWLQSAVVTLTPKGGGEPLAIEFEPLTTFLMKGLGYGEPTWGHGIWVGEAAVDGTEYEVAKEQPLQNLHVQQLSRVRAGGQEGLGVFEILAVGPHAPSGFRELLDPAP
ncbi:hypothetical protein [Tepidiforma sp.]|uniref:hypothetical protein n=1 Tax=Tepidiforma sp. TaxID=2682230 RepID=UPI002ADD9F1D|nr:hypothetical protein [Tepidiforma sp.]